MLLISPLDCDRVTSQTLAGAFAASTRNTPVPTSGFPGTLGDQVLRSPVLQ